MAASIYVICVFVNYVNFQPENIFTCHFDIDFKTYSILLCLFMAFLDNAILDAGNLMLLHEKLWEKQGSFT